MGQDSDDKELLTNAVKQPAAALTAVQIDSPIFGDALIDELVPVIGNRPYAIIHFSASDNPLQVLDNARKITKDWPSETGVLFILDQGKEASEKASVRSWRILNSLRENLYALNCHVIFLLLPSNYEKLLQVADHLADWMPLKLSYTVQKDRLIEDWSFGQLDYIMNSNATEPAKGTSELLNLLDQQLLRALQKGIDESLLIRRYHLPIFKLAVDSGQFDRARAIGKNIREKDLAGADLRQWYDSNINLEQKNGNLAKAREWLIRYQDWAESKKDVRLKAIIEDRLGVLAAAEHDYGKAKAFHLKSLSLRQTLGDDTGIATSYFHLGVVAYKQKDLKSSEKWLMQSLEMKERSGDKTGLTIIYQHLGFLFFEYKEYQKSKKWLLKALDLFKLMENTQKNIAKVHLQLALACYGLGKPKQGDVYFKKFEEFPESKNPAVIKRWFSNLGSKTDQNPLEAIRALRNHLLKKSIAENQDMNS